MVWRWLFAIILLLPASLPARAWDDRGHAAIGLLAERFLTSSARTRVAEILDGASLAEVASWADEVRPQRPETREWHFINIPIGAAGYDPSWCPASGCVVRALVEALLALPRTEIGVGARRDALRFLVHFVGDLHQPVHVADNDDRGGNQVRVRIGGRETNLHAVWDIDVVAALGTDAAAVADRLATEAASFPGGIGRIGAGNVIDWVSESFVAGQLVHRALGGGGFLPPRNGDRVLDLPDDYPRAHSTLAAQQLMRAGVRLAVLLNEALP